MKAMTYGWVIVGVTVIGLATGWAAIGIFGFGAFVGPLQSEFGWQRGELSFAQVVINLTGTLVAPVLGLLVDRYGVKRVLAPSTFALGILVASLYLLTDNIWHFYTVWFLVALLGCAASPLCYSRVIVNWFDDRRGIALGIGLSGVGLGAALMPVVAQALISGFGWRVAYLSLGLVLVGITTPLILILLRDAPVDVSREPLQGSGGDIGSKLTSGFTVRQAFAQRSVWFIAIIFMFTSMAVTAVVVHLIPMLVSRGFTPENAAKLQGLLGVSLIFGRIFVGYLVDRFFAPRIAMIFLFGPVLGTCILASGMSGPAVYIAVTLVGLAIGAEFDLLGYLTSRYVGIFSYGTIFGFLFAAFQTGSAAGAVIMGYCHDFTGDYTLALWLMGFVALISCVLTAQLGPYPELPQQRKELLPPDLAYEMN